MSRRSRSTRHTCAKASTNTNPRPPTHSLTETKRFSFINHNRDVSKWAPGRREALAKARTEERELHRAHVLKNKQQLERPESAAARRELARNAVAQAFEGGSGRSRRPVDEESVDATASVASLGSVASMTESEYLRVQREEKRKWWIKFQRDSSIEREERPERWLGAQWDGTPNFSTPEDILPSSAHEPWVERDIVDLLFKEPINPPMLSGPRSAVGAGKEQPGSSGSAAPGGRAGRTRRPRSAFPGSRPSAFPSSSPRPQSAVPGSRCASSTSAASFSRGQRRPASAHSRRVHQRKAKAAGKERPWRPTSAKPLSLQPSEPSRSRATKKRPRPQSAAALNSRRDQFTRVGRSYVSSGRPASAAPRSSPRQSSSPSVPLGLEGPSLRDQFSSFLGEIFSKKPTAQSKGKNTKKQNRKKRRGRRRPKVGRQKTMVAEAEEKRSGAQEGQPDTAQTLRTKVESLKGVKPRRALEILRALTREYLGLILKEERVGTFCRTPFAVTRVPMTHKQADALKTGIVFNAARKTAGPCGCRNL